MRIKQHLRWLCRNKREFKGSFINLGYPLPNGQAVKLWDDNKIYFGNQIHKKGCNRCYGIAADEKYLMVSEYGENGSDAEIVIFQRWNQAGNSSIYRVKVPAASLVLWFIPSIVLINPYRQIICPCRILGTCLNHIGKTGRFG